MQQALGIIKKIGQISALFLLSQFGNWLMATLHIKFPGSIIGLIILLVLLITKTVPENWIASGADTLLAYMTLFFIPVTVGIVDYPELLSGSGLLILGIIFVSTILSIVFSGIATQMAEKHLKSKRKNQIDNITETHFETIQQKGEV